MVLHLLEILSTNLYLLEVLSMVLHLLEVVNVSAPVEGFVV